MFFSHQSSHHVSSPLPLPEQQTTFSFEDYDRLRRQKELADLNDKQSRRAAAEAAALRAEADRRELAAYRAVAKQQQQIQAVEQERRRLEQRRIEVAIEHLRRQREVEAIQRRQAEHQQARLQHLRQQELLRRQHLQASAQYQQQEEEEEDALAAYFQRAFLGGAARPSPSATAPNPSSSACPCAAPSQRPAPIVPSSSKAPQPKSEEAPQYELVFHIIDPSSSSSPSTESNPTQATAPSPAPVVETPEAIAAAEKVQREYRAHLLRKHQLSRVSSLSSELAAKQSSFILPSTSLEFVEGKEKKLAFSPGNTALLAYEDFLSGLLSKIDEVQSGGDKIVKLARKDLVTRVETELRVLDGKKESDWRALKGKGKEFVAESSGAVAELSTSESVVVDTPNLSASPAVEESTSTPATETDALPFVVQDSVAPSDILDSSSPSELGPAVDSAETNAPASQDEQTLSSASSQVVDTPAQDQLFPSTSADSTTPLTPAHLARVPSYTAAASKSPSSDSDGSHSTETLSIPDTDAVIDNVLSRAKELGEAVAKKEEGEQEEGFVVV